MTTKSAQALQHPSAGGGHPGARVTASYIEDLLRELEGLAAQEHIEPLRDLLRLAKEEARRAAASC